MVQTAGGEIGRWVGSCRPESELRLWVVLVGDGLKAQWKRRQAMSSGSVHPSCDGVLETGELVSVDMRIP